jgi:flagellar assembly factor FliW
VDEGKIIIMPGGMPGFPGMKRFIILDREETRPFYWYQSVDNSDLAFVIMNPRLFKPDYSVDLKSTIKEMSWEMEPKGNLALYVVVNASSDVPEEITANLLGPLVINTKKCEAVQMVIQNSPYSHKHPVFAGSGKPSG